MHPQTRLGAGLVLACLAIAPAWSAGPPDTTEDGLKLTTVKGIDLAYVRPGASFASYKRFMVDPADVAFAKDWKPNRPGSNLPISKGEREEIRTGLAKLFDETFAAELQKGGYAVVKESAPDVLRVTAKIIDVYINAPNVGATAGRNKTFVMNAGRMALVVELRDSETGAVLARAADRSQARENQQLQWSSGPSNVGEATDMIKAWAKILRERMDAVRKQPAS
jgi:hypothetical protein